MKQKHERTGELERRLVQDIRGMIAVRDLHDPEIYTLACKLVRRARPDAEMMREQVKAIRNRLADLSAHCAQMLYNGNYAGRECEVARRLSGIINRYRVEIDAINEAIEEY